MRHRVIRALVLAVVVVCGARVTAPAQQETESASASKVIALENAWNRASEAKDLKALDQILDEAFVYVRDDGRQMTKAEILKDVKESSVQQVAAESMVAHVHGEAAVVTGLYRMKDVVRGKLFVRQGRFVDTWLYTNGRWVAIASVSTPLE